MSEARYVATDYAALLEALRAMKAELELSNSVIDHLCGWTHGHCDKLLGPTESKLIGAKTLMDLLWVFAARIEIVRDPKRLAEMEQHWEQRMAGCVTPPNRVSKVLVRRAQPVVMRKLGQIGGQVTAYKRSDAQRSASARKAARA